MERVQERAFERRWAILAVLCFSLLVIVLDNSILNVAIPTLVDKLSASNSQVQWMVDSYTLVFAGLLLTAGSLGDRFGRRGALQVGFAVFGLGSAISAVATSAGQLIATRAVMGIGGAFIMPATLSIITNLFPPHERGRAIGAWAGVAGLGGALGPIAGGFLLEHFYWGSIFLVNLPVVVLGVIAGFFLIPTSKDATHSKLDPLGAVLSIGGLGALLYGIIQGPDAGWRDPTTVVALAAGAVLLAGFLAWERTTRHPMLDVSFFRNPRFSAASAAITLTFFAMFGSVFLLTQYLQFVLGYSPLTTGVRLLPFAGSIMIVAPASARVAERIGTKLTVTLGLVLVTAGLLSLTALRVDTTYAGLVWRLVLMSTGLGLTMAPATDSVMGSLPLAKAGVGSAVNDTTRQVGGALGVAVVGSILSSTYGSKVAGFFAGTQAPDGAREAARRSLGGALQVADRLRNARFPGAARLAGELARTAEQSFVDAMHRSVLGASVATAIGIVVALRFLPATAPPGHGHPGPGHPAEAAPTDAGGALILEPSADVDLEADPEPHGDLAPQPVP
ncbi:MAG: MFS transporter [Actinobacteria bacterium]|nr:MFS transporter [Actinomycetota bacterium]